MANCFHHGDTENYNGFHHGDTENTENYNCKTWGNYSATRGRSRGERSSPKKWPLLLPFSVFSVPPW